MRTLTKKLFDAYSIASGSVAGQTLSCSEIVLVSAQWAVTGSSPTGTLKLQGSNDSTNWTDIPSATASVSAVGNGMISVVDVPYLYVRPFWTQTSGTGTLTVIAVGKGP